MSDDRQRFFAYSVNVNTFVQTTLGAAIIDDVDYIAGTERIDFHEKLVTRGSLQIYDYRRDGVRIEGTYEEALFQRLLSLPASLLVLVGGLGSGKSTVVRHLTKMITDRQTEICATFPCECKPCARYPVTVNCIDIDRSYSLDDAVAEVLRLIRREIYEHTIDEWLHRQGHDANALSDEQRKVLRRLLIANDIYKWADAESLHFPSSLHTPALTLTGKSVLAKSLTQCRVENLFARYEDATDLLDQPLDVIVHDINEAKKLTSVVVGFHLRPCARSSPNNLIIVDNLDQQPTEHIEAIVNHLHDLAARLPGLRILVPLRPSSITPQGFTYNPEYMYHYGPNCYDLVFRRLSRYVLGRSKAELRAPIGAPRTFVKTPAPEEEFCFLVATYLYALIALRGLRPAADPDADVVPEVHPDLEFLHRVSFSGAALQHLSDTLGAIVGTCGRYAIAQLTRYFHHIYMHPFFLTQALAAGLSMGVDAKLHAPYGLVVTALLGDYDGQPGVTALANLYAPTELGANPGRPSLAKLRILAFLAKRYRVYVHDIARELALFGIPYAITIEALNYLHEKNRLLLWFSRNSDLTRDGKDDEQYVIISEHGQAYLKNLAGDFEYMWFCSQQLVARATGDRLTSFGSRLNDYSRLVIAFGASEWKQMTFRRFASGVLWSETNEIEEGEMLILYVLYSSLRRGLNSAVVAARQQAATRAYVADIVTTVTAVSEAIMTWQDKYEIYYGGNGYLVRYGALIAECKTAIEKSMDSASLAGARDALGAVLESWSRGAVQSGAFAEDLLARQVLDDQVAWEQFLGAMPFSITPSTEWLSPDHVGATRRRLLLRRHALRNLLQSRLPTYGVVESNLSMLIDEISLARDTARQIASLNPLFSEWIEDERSVLEQIHRGLVDNAFKVGARCDFGEMDTLKERANNISALLVRLARRVGANRTDHLAVRWSL